MGAYTLEVRKQAHFIGQNTAEKGGLLALVLLYCSNLVEYSQNGTYTDYLNTSRDRMNRVKEIVIWATIKCEEELQSVPTSYSSYHTY